MKQSLYTDLERIANEYDIEPAVLRAVVQIESGGVVGDPDPVIRIEGHYFYRRLSGVKRDAAVRQGLASPKAGKVKNPSSQAARYQMLAQMVEIDEKAAYESVSWGVGQVMGSNWQALGYQSVNEFVDVVKSDVTGQVRVMMQYIVVNKLLDTLKTKNWAAFARGYNGPSYAKWGYDKKLAKAYASEAGAVAVGGNLKMGAKGADVRDLQDLLRKNGYAVNIDGDFGPRTHDAVVAFQNERGIVATGEVNPETWNLLETRSPETKFSNPGDAELKVGKIASAVGTGGVVAAEVGNQVLATSSALRVFSEYSSIAVGLSMLALLVGTGFVIWGIYKRKTQDPKPA